MTETAIWQFKNVVVTSLTLFVLLSGAYAHATIVMYTAMKPEQGKEDAVVEHIESTSLMNCKQLVEQSWEIVILRLECNTREDLGKAMSTELVPVELISGATSWINPAME